jgi:hypothetical protein
MAPIWQQFADAQMSEPKNVIDAMVAMRSDIERRLLSNKDYVLLCSLDAAIRAHTSNGGGSFRRLEGRPQSQTDAARAVLAEIGHPMVTGDLLEAVARRGVTIGGANPNTNFSSALSRDPRFTSVHWNGSRRWWVVDLALPPDPKPGRTKELAMA